MSQSLALLFVLDRDNSSEVLVISRKQVTTRHYGFEFLLGNQDNQQPTEPTIKLIQAEIRP